MTDTKMTDKATTDVAIDTSSALERRIDMTVAMAEIDKDVEQRLKRMSRTVKMAGFRPGKVPMKMVAQQYGSQARSEAIGAAVEKAYGEKVREQNLRVAGYPRIEPRIDPNSDASPGLLGFTAVFEVYPEVTSADVSGQTIEKPLLTVTEAEVDKTLDVLRKQRTTYVETDRAAIKDDRLAIDFVGRKDGEEFPGGKASDYTVMVGGGMMLPDFETQLEGVRTGDTKSFDVNFPADYQATELAGSTVQFEMAVKKVEAPQLPEIDADFAKQLGVADGDVAKMRVEVRSNLEREVKKRLLAKVKEQVMDALLKVNPIEVPKALVEMESQQMAETARRDMESRGMGMKNIPVDASWFTEQATRRVKLGLLLAELVKAKDLHVKPEQVRTIVDEFAETFEDPKEVVRWYYSQPQRLAEAEALALENNVVDWVLANAKVSEVPIAFDALMGNAA
ncbi:MAG: trigger factor [Sulfuritalea sp.]|nr:trigger factor [Sulfuritalea sp.]